MKIAWFTPFGIKSAIGAYSKHAAEALAQYEGAVVDLFVEKQDKMHETTLRKIFFKDYEDVEDLLPSYDAVIYNMGNYAPFHAAIYDVLLAYPGIVISHDVSMAEFMLGYCNRQDPAMFGRLLGRLYGQEAAVRILYDIGSRAAVYKVDFLKYNMQEFVLRTAKGVVVHSRYHARVLEEKRLRPVAVIPLIEMCDVVGGGDGESPIPAGRVSMLTVGQANWNKMSLEVMEAIGKNRFLRENICYYVVGATNDSFYLDRLFRLHEKLKLEDCVKLIGYVDYQTLNRYYSNVDMICNLRYPAFEGGSASLQEALLRGKPTLVLDTGLYHGLPDDCVVKVSVADMEKELPDKLTALVKNAQYREELGTRGRAFAQEYYDKQKYAKKMIAFIEEVARPDLKTAPLRRLLEKVRVELKETGMNTTLGEPRLQVVDGIGRDIEYLFDIDTMPKRGDSKKNEDMNE